MKKISIIYKLMIDYTKNNVDAGIDISWAVNNLLEISTINGLYTNNFEDFTILLHRETLRSHSCMTISINSHNNKIRTELIVVYDEPERYHNESFNDNINRINKLITTYALY